MTNETDGMTNPDRRTVLKSMGALSIGGISTTLLDPSLVYGQQPEPLDTNDVNWTSERSSTEVFPLSVTSGGPTDSGAILWTKLSQNACKSSNPAYVQVAKDKTFSDPIYEGRIHSNQIKAENNYIIKVDLDGELPSDSHLYYRFHYKGTTSQIGRCRTLPKAETSVDQVRLAVVTCQMYQHGYYPAYNYIADENVDYIVHLGDQIYEGTYDTPFADRSFELPSGKDIAWNLNDFRFLWNTYRGDEFFQRALERHTFIPTWDDHEIVNNPWWDYENDRPRTDDHPKDDNKEALTQLFIDAIKAWWEYNPARVRYDPSAEHLHDRFHMWRSLRFGDLLELPVTDERLYRSPPPGGDAAGQRQAGIPPNAPEHDDGDRTMLGFEQREWFLDTLKQTDATWKVWTNEVTISPVWRAGGDHEQFFRIYDNWDGYEHERKEILGQLAHFDVSNFIALTGDMHAYLIAYLMNDFEETENRTPIPSKEELVGVELMTPALTSNFTTSDFWGIEDRTSVESESPESTNESTVEYYLEGSPNIEFFNAKYNGYSIAEFTPDACTWTTYAVDDTVDDSSANHGVLRKYRIPEGEVDLIELEANDSPLPEEKANL